MKSGLCILFRFKGFWDFTGVVFDNHSKPSPSPFLTAKLQRCALVQLHKARGPQPLFFISLPKAHRCGASCNKKRERDGADGSKSNTETMKSYQILKNEAEQKLKNKKKGAALDEVSKSVLKNSNAMCNPSALGRPLNPLIMSNIRNHVQLIGNVGDNPTIPELKSGKKLARFPLATNEQYKNAEGEKVESTDWHNIVAWDKTAEIIEKYVTKGKQIGVFGKLKTRTFTTDDGNERYVTEIIADEILLLGGKPETAPKE